MADIVPLKPTPALAGLSAAATAVVTAAPHSVPAEQALLGALMVNNKLLDDLGGSLTDSHFYVPLHAQIFSGIEVLVNRGREANPITVREALRGSAYDDDATLLPQLSAMFESAALAAEVKSLAEVIHTTYLQRQLITLGQSLSQQASGAHAPEEANAVLDGISGELFKLAESGQSTSTITGLRNPLLEVIKRAEQAHKDGTGLTGVSTGFLDLDHLLGGLQNSDLIILAARPSMGKTALAINIAQNAARKKLRGEANGAGVGVFSLEMGADQLAARILSSATGVSTMQLTNGQMSKSDFAKLVPMAAELAEMPIYIDDTPGLSINALRARARRMKRQYGIGMLVVDYLQLMSAPNVKGDNRVQEVSQISQGLKIVARELGIPVIALSQLSRSVENRDNKRPQLSDLRESGSIEQDADLVLFLYREEYYLQRQLGAEDAMDEKSQQLREKLEQSRGKTEVLISKNRKGATGVVTLMFVGETTTFHNHDKGHFRPSSEE